MFLTILENVANITKFWGELTTQTHYVKCGQLRNYVHIDTCPRRHLHRMPAFKKAKTPCRMRDIPSKSDKTNEL